MSFPFERARHLLIDLDGVIYRGNSALPGAESFISWLRERQIVFRLVTNNSTLTPQSYVRKLAGMGITVEEEEVFTSALATALYLQQHGEAGKSACLIGEEGLHAAMNDVGMRVVDDGPEWVIVGLDRDLTYERLTAAALALEQGARFLATNGDTSLPTERGLVPGAGAILAALTATTGQQPIVIGKPQPLMLQLAMDAVGGSVENTVMLGDRLDTDIGAAQAVDIPSILVLTGVSTRADLAHSQIQPTLVVDNLNELMQLWLHHH